MDGTCRGEGDQRKPFERHEEESYKKVAAEEKSAAGGMSPRSPASWAEMREARRGMAPFFLDVEVKHITFNSQTGEVSVCRLTWFSGSCM